MAKKLKNSNKNIASVLFVIVIILLCLSCLVYFFKKPIQIESFYSEVAVMNNTGINVNSTALTFGGIIPSSSASRKVIFENKYDFVVNAHVSANGSIAKFMSFQKDWQIEAGETKMIMFSVEVPLDTKEGTYDGYVSIEIFKAGLF
jgi:uncharacterized membrane protein YtjA (UPF0391 family)